MDKKVIMKSPLMVALDVDSDQRALQLADELADVVGGFKVGPRLLLRYGQPLAQALAARAPLFIDCKFFDIPSTMEAAVTACFDMGATLVTVHALSGHEALQRLAQLEQRLNQQRPFRLLCVTILTSWDEKTLPAVMKTQSINQHVVQLADLVQSAGLSGLVCSPEELPAVQGRGLYLVTPGIRTALQPSTLQDQKRVLSPAQAMALGASALVVGRPIIESPHPRATAIDMAVALLQPQNSQPSNA